MKFRSIYLILSVTVLVKVDASLSDYFTSVGEFFGYAKTKDLKTGDVYQKRIPYEVTAVDQKFISEAAKLTGIALSDLDSCQHRVSIRTADVYRL